MSIGLLSPIFIFIGWSPNASPKTDPKQIGNCVMLGPMASSGVHAPDCLVAFCAGFAKIELGHNTKYKLILISQTQ